MKDSYVHIQKLGKHRLINNNGEIISTLNGKKKVLSQGVSTRGYKQIGFRQNGKIKVYTIHRLVAEAFIPNPENKPCINHIDTNKFNNNVSNLEWCTYKENYTHAKNNGLQNNLPSRLGVKHSEKTKLKIQLATVGIPKSEITKKRMKSSNSKSKMILNLETGIFYDSIRDVSLLLNKSNGYVSNRINNKVKKLNNFPFINI